MSRICPLTNVKVTYLVCQDCNQRKECNELILKRAQEKRTNMQTTQKLKDLIIRELDHVAVTNDVEEVNRMLTSLELKIRMYALKNIERIDAAHTIEQIVR